MDVPDERRWRVHLSLGISRCVRDETSQNCRLRQSLSARLGKKRQIVARRSMGTGRRQTRLRHGAADMTQRRGVLLSTENVRRTWVGWRRSSVAAPLDTLPVTLVECPVCHFAKAALAYRKVNRSYFFCPACKHVWNLPSKLPASEGLSRSRQDEISARLRSIRSLCQVLERMSRTSARYRGLAADLQAEAVAYVKLVDAERGVDRTRHRRS
jgi:hypothetical protein